jgi:hypothetical protein
MPTIIIETIIKTDKQIVFDLSRSIDLHKISTKETNEEAIAGVTSGLTHKFRHPQDLSLSASTSFQKYSLR